MARFAITDIHGCALTLKALVEEKLKLKKEDELYLLGDLVNKGPDSKGVLDYIRHLQKEQYQVTCLRGNHDQMLLDAYHKGDKATNLSPEEKKMTLASFGIAAYDELPKKYYNFPNIQHGIFILKDVLAAEIEPGMHHKVIRQFQVIG